MTQGDKSSIERFPEGINRNIKWQRLQDTAAPEDIYTNVYMFVCLGEPHCPYSLQCSNFPSIPLSYVAAAGWIVVLSAFSIAGWGEVVSICFWQETSPREEERRREGEVKRGEESYPKQLSIFSLSGGTRMPRHTRLKKERLAHHQLGINNSAVLHYTNVYVPLLAEHRRSVLYWDPQRFIKPHRTWRTINGKHFEGARRITGGYDSIILNFCALKVLEESFNI